MTTPVIESVHEYLLKRSKTTLFENSLMLLFDCPLCIKALEFSLLDGFSHKIVIQWRTLLFLSQGRKHTHNNTNKQRILVRTIIPIHGFLSLVLNTVPGALHIISMDSTVLQNII